MQRTNFESLQIYQLAERLSDAIWKIVVLWEPFAKETVGKQIVRAADSIGANIAEGSGKGTNQDLRRFLRISRGSLYETKYWLKRAYQRKLIGRTEIEEVKPLLDELLPKLNAYLRTVSKNIDT